MFALWHFLCYLARDVEGAGGHFGTILGIPLYSFRIISLFLLFTRFHISVCFLKIDTHYLFNTYYIFNHFSLIDVTTSSPITG